MSRKKMNVLVIFGIIFLYILSGYLSYASTRDYYTKLTENDIIFSRERLKSDYLQKIFDGRLEDESMQDIACSIGRIYDVDPSAVAIYDNNYKMLAQSGSCIICDNMDGVIPVEKYLTDEIKEKIADVGGYGLYYSIYRFEYHADANDGDIIPVSISISSLVNQCDKEITVKLADAEPTNVIDNGDPLYEDVIMSLYLYNSDINENFNKNCRKAIDNVNNIDLIKEYTKGLGSDEFSIGTPMGFHIENLRFPDGNCYYLVTSVVYDADYNTLISADFKNLILSLTIVYAIAGAVILISSNKLYSKNKNMNETRQAFTSAAAHELKTPITIINNQCECLLKNVAPEKKDEYISAIYKQNNRMSHLVTGLLQYNRLSSKVKLNKTDVHLESIIDNELEKYDALIENKKIDVEKNICKNAVIQADSEMISLVLDNFISNAVKYTDKENKIKICVENTAKGFKVSVFNSGNGVKAEYADRIWDIFNRSYDEDDNSTGMGLAICKKILELHKYKYGFENRNDGVEFYFSTK